MQTSSSCCLTIAIIVGWPAYAMDCAKPRGPVERAICSNPDLEAADEKLSAAMSEALTQADKDTRRALMVSQRKWRAARNKACRKAEDVEACIDRRTSKRLAELAGRDRQPNLTTSAPASASATSMLLDAEHQLQLGPATIDVVRQTNGTFLVYDGKAISPNIEGKNKVIGLFKAGRVEAALLFEGEGGTLHCGNFAVVSWQATRGIGHTPMAYSCQMLDAHFDWTGPTQDGFHVRQAPAPFETREQISWSPAGAVKITPLVFAPVAGSKLIDAQGRDEPLKSEDLYKAIESQTGEDAMRFYRAFWHLNAFYDASGKGIDPDYLGSTAEVTNLHPELYGMHRDKQLVWMQACGWRADEGSLHCGNDDAFAILETRSDRFYFAIRPHLDDDKAEKNGGTRPAVTTYPELAQWPAPVRSIYDKWLKPQS